jgi:hypothetical protein
MLRRASLLFLRGDKAFGLLWLGLALDRTPPEDEDTRRRVLEVYHKSLTQPTLRAEHRLHQDQVRTLSFSQDGHRLLTASADKTARLWDAATGQPLTDPLHHDGFVSAILSPNDKYVLTGCSDHMVRLWDAGSGQPIGKPLWYGGLVEYGLAFQPDGKVFVAGDLKGQVRFWTTDTLEPAGPLLRNDHGAMTIVYHPEGKRILIGSHAGANQRDVTTFQTLSPHADVQGWCKALAYSPDGTEFVCGAGGDPMVWIRSTATGRPRDPPLRFPPGRGLHVAVFSPDGRLLVTSAKEVVQLWDVERVLPIGSPLIHDKEVTSVALSPDGRTLATGDSDGVVRLWAMPNPKEHAGLEQEVLRWQVETGVGLGPDGRLRVLPVEELAERRHRLGRQRP